MTIETLLPNNLGDVSFHAGLVAYFQRGGWGPFLWPQHPLLVDTALGYPFGTDFLTAMLAQIGLPLTVLLPLLFLLASLVLGRLLLQWTDSDDTGFGWLGLLAFVGCCGLAWPGLAAAAPWWQPSLSFKSLFFSMWVTQRGLLVAVPAGLLCLMSWRWRWLVGQESRALPWVVEAMLVGLMPLFHMHTALVLVSTWLLWVLLAAFRDEVPAVPGRVFYSVWRGWALACAVGLGPAAMLLSANPAAAVGAGAYATGLLRWHAGWQAATFGQPLLLYLVQNMAPVGCWVGLAWGLLLQRPTLAHRFAGRSLLLTACTWGALVLLFQISPWDWDNSKLWLWAVLLVLPLMPMGVSVLLPYHKWGVAILVLATLVLPGGLAVTQFGGQRLLTGHGYTVAVRSDIDHACGQLAMLSVNSRVAVAPVFNHPVILCGQPVWLGYEQHLWSHGYGARARVQAQALDAFMVKRHSVQVADAAQAAQAPGSVRAMWWGPMEQQRWADGSLNPHGPNPNEGGSGGLCLLAH
ncbi:MAG: hypothetical protein R2857_14595 [Vampirovibrionales bacterium]